LKKCPHNYLTDYTPVHEATKTPFEERTPDRAFLGKFSTSLRRAKVALELQHHLSCCQFLFTVFSVLCNRHKCLAQWGQHFLLEFSASIVNFVLVEI
jgi:hypothetical protein